jgi:hypothetical protein
MARYKRYVSPLSDVPVVSELDDKPAPLDEEDELVLEDDEPGDGADEDDDDDDDDEELVVALLVVESLALAATDCTNFWNGIHRFLNLSSSLSSSPPPPPPPSSSSSSSSGLIDDVSSEALGVRSATGPPSFCCKRRSSGCDR